MKPRQCPHCGTCANADSGYYFDVDFSMVCGICSNVMYPTCSSDEHKITKKETWVNAKAVKRPKPHKRVPKGNNTVVYNRPSGKGVIGFVSERELFVEPDDNLQAEAEIESGI